ncbi:hypothetical protein FisN_13Hh025 [Fistulifera solaris]|uniref:HSF-type DNA-binding domain-containing protein n=1 Tax=Fistulifera solaris TaxID=1519565 RepID=A0A1Z5KNF9_FISSO|nr:hypothetical protein FisN_13Hh025 [Fistulifera solaris]|eukprot:GAX27864.1 hypothetical protein FisN_13Hh025 [Fistulifera solaris]
MDNNPLKRGHEADAEVKVTPQKRGKVNAEEKDDGKIDYKIQRRSPSLVNNPSSAPLKKDEDISSKRPFGSEKTQMTFPEKIMRILSFPEFTHVIRWNAQGTEFSIVPDSFTETVLEPHFQGTKFQSFTRKLNRWGFKRILDEDRYPKGTFAYRHEYFQRGKEDLVKKMEIDSDKKQRKLAVSDPVRRPVTTDENPAVREEIKAESRPSDLNDFSNQLSGVLASPPAAAGLPVASTVAHLPSQSELNRIQFILESQRAMQQRVLLSQSRLPPLRHASFPGAETSFDPLLSSLNLHSPQMQMPFLDAALARGLSYQRQDQLAQALQQLPGQQRQQIQGQQSIDPLLLQLLLARQAPERRHSSPQP